MEQQSQHVLQLSTRFIELVEKLDPTWKRAFFRFSVEPIKYGSNASYESAAGVNLIDPLEVRGFFHEMNETAVALFQEIAKERGVLLLVVDAASAYSVQFEYDDLERWKITKLGGRTGIPEGL